MGFPGGSDCKKSACKAGDLGWEDPLEEGMAIHSSVLAWRISMDRGTWWAIFYLLYLKAIFLSFISLAPNRFSNLVIVIVILTVVSSGKSLSNASFDPCSAFCVLHEWSHEVGTLILIFTNEKPEIAQLTFPKLHSLCQSCACICLSNLTVSYWKAKHIKPAN